VAECKPFEIEVSNKDKGKQLVIVIDRTSKTEVHRDRIDVNLANARKRLLNAVSQKSQVDDAELKALENALIKEADHVLQQQDNSFAMFDLDSYERPNSTEILLGLCEDIELFHTADSDAYALIDEDSALKTFQIRKAEFKSWLTKQFFERQGKAPPAQALQDTINTLAARAEHEGEEREIFLRTCKQGNTIYVDLANSRWEVVMITPAGWRVLKQSPIRFRRTKSMLALPKPEPDGNLTDLTRLLNISVSDWPLVQAWILACFNSEIPYPVLCLSGQQGTSKSTTAKTLRSLVDPNKAPIRSAARSERDLFISAENNWILPFDNLSRISPSMSDSLCRLSTGGAFSTRQLYADGEEAIFNARRPVIITGIEEVVTQADLLDRSLLVELEPIAPEDRITETEFNARLEEIYPSVIGIIFDLLALGLSNEPNTKLQSPPRMADFATWAHACCSSPEQGDEFLAAYNENLLRGSRLTLESDPVAMAIIKTVDANGGQWSGTISNLSEILSSPLYSLRNSDLVNSPKALGGYVKRIIPALKAIGIEVTNDRNSQKRVTTLTRIPVF